LVVFASPGVFPIAVSVLVVRCTSLSSANGAGVCCWWRAHDDGGGDDGGGDDVV
jgi:hypothetical protein